MAIRQEGLASGLPVGVLAPGFRLPATGGQELALEDLRGQAVLLVFLRHLA